MSEQPPEPYTLAEVHDDFLEGILTSFVVWYDKRLDATNPDDMQQARDAAKQFVSELPRP